MHQYLPERSAAAHACSIDFESQTLCGAHGTSEPEIEPQWQGDYPSPRSVTRGESHPSPELPDQHGCLAHIDWFAFTLMAPYRELPQLWIEPLLAAVFGVPRDQWEFTGNGWQGYAERVNLGDLGLLAYGGESQAGTLHVSLNAKACALIADWRAVRVFGETYKARISRIDLAHDDFSGATVDIQRALSWFRDGGFNAKGRPATGRFIDDLGSGKGSTLYVGSRASGKLCRIYEKGKQLGEQQNPWTRIEVEFHNKSRFIPWETVTAPTPLLAGAYPCMAYLSLEQSKLKTVRNTYEISYKQMVKTVRMVSGRALNVMCAVNGGDTVAVLAEVMRDGKPKRLSGLPDHGQL